MLRGNLGGVYGVLFREKVRETGVGGEEQVEQASQSLKRTSNSGDDIFRQRALFLPMLVVQQRRVLRALVHPRFDARQATKPRVCALRHRARSNSGHRHFRRTNATAAHTPSSRTGGTKRVSHPDVRCACVCDGGRRLSRVPQINGKINNQHPSEHPFSEKSIFRLVSCAFMGMRQDTDGLRFLPFNKGHLKDTLHLTLKLKGRMHRITMKMQYRRRASARFSRGRGAAPSSFVKRSVRAEHWAGWANPQTGTAWSVA